MSKIKVNSLEGVGASTPAISIDNSSGTCTANITNNLSNRNIIINGAMQINQRGNLTGQTSSVYSLDRFRVSMGTAGTWSLSQSTDTPDGFGSSMKLDCTTANGSLSAGSYMILQQKIEGQNVQGFAKGTSAAKQFAVSFYIKSNVSGTYVAEIQDNDNDRIASKTFTVSNGNWNRYSLIFPADTTGTLDNDNAISLSLNFWLVAGTTYSSGTLNTSTWAGKVHGNRAAGIVNFASSTSNELYITGVQLEVGSVNTEYEMKSIGQELTSCQRYYQRIATGTGQALSENATMYNSDSIFFSIPLPTTMRIAPTLDVANGSNYFVKYENNGAIYFNTLGRDGVTTPSVLCLNQSPVSGGGGNACMIRTDDANTYVAAVAEL